MKDRLVLSLMLVMAAASVACSDREESGGEGGTGGFVGYGTSQHSTVQLGGHNSGHGVSTGGEVTFCEPGETRPCYTGPDGTEGVGRCAAGTQTCLPDGSAFTDDCESEVLPVAEGCFASQEEDEDCDGVANEADPDCMCVPDSETTCYTGPSATLGVGPCVSGMVTCNDEGTSFGICVGEVVPAFDDCTTPIDEDCSGGSPSCSGAHVWSKRMGTVGPDFATLIALDPAGNAFLTTGGGSVAKLDPAGGELWSKLFVVEDGGGVSGVAADKGGNVLIAGFGVIEFGAPQVAGLFVGKLTPAGNHLWSRGLGGSGSEFFISWPSVATDPAGNVLLVGSFEGTADFGGGPLASAGASDVFIVKLDPAGNHLWSKRFGDASDQSGVKGVFDTNGNVIVVGTFGGTVDFGGGPLVSAGDLDAFVAKLDADGNHLFSKRAGDADIQSAVDVTTDGAGNIAFTGYMYGAADFGGGLLTSAGESDAFAVKLDAGGNHVWSKRFGDSNSQEAWGIAADPAGNVVVTGRFAGSANFGAGTIVSHGLTDAFVLKLGASGNHLWSKRFGDAAEQSGALVAIDGTGAAVVSGEFWGEIDFGGGPLVSAGAYDTFLAKLAP